MCTKNYKQEWLLTDLHMHSEFSKIRKPGDRKNVKKMSAEEFVEVMHNNKIKIFSITDHNYFASDYYDQIEKYILDNDYEMSIINGFEADTYVDVENDKFIHICIYFEKNTNRKDLENAITRLYTEGTGKPTLYDIVNELYNLKSKFILVPHGDKANGLFPLVLKEGDVVDCTEYNKYAMYKIFSAFDVSPRFYEKSLEMWAKNFYEFSHHYYEYAENMSEDDKLSLNKKIIEKLKNKDVVLNDDEEKVYEYIIKYGSYFSYFTFSDWHNNNDYNPRVSNFIFGRLDLAFESFEMATLDPISRVVNIPKDCNGNLKKEIVIPNDIIESLEFTINGVKKKINLSPGLNAIVGKRGSGKSLLLAVLNNLKDANAEKGAKVAYSSLNVGNIKGYNRGGIPISEGSLSKITFLAQEQIRKIYDNPDADDNEVNGYFKECQALDFSKLNEIIKLCKEIQPYNNNYKSVTSNLVMTKTSMSYIMGVRELIDYSSIEGTFVTAVNDLEKCLNVVKEEGLNSNFLKQEIVKMKNVLREYLVIAKSYNFVIQNNNDRVDKYNSEIKNDERLVRQNIATINEAKSVIKGNFKICCELEKLKILLDNFEVNSPKVEVVKKGNYLFVSYYKISDSIRDEVKQKISESLYKVGSSDLYSYLYDYLYSKYEHKLKAGKTLSSELEKYKFSSDFKVNKEFYEIKSNDLSFIDKIENVKDLEKYESEGKILNLTNSSPGTRSAAYLDMLFNLDDNILVLDQPEDNIDNDYISNKLVPNIKEQKKNKQLIFVTHNPSVAVYGDAFNYIVAENTNNNINYQNYFIEKKEDRDDLMRILEGGKPSFSNRNKKFGNILGEEEYENI